MFTKITGTDNGLETITWSASDEQGETVQLTVHTSGLILSIDTRKDVRGEGLARSIYEFACTEMDIYHVPVWGRTPEGDAFAEAVDGETMDDEAAAAIVGFDLSILDHS